MALAARLADPGAQQVRALTQDLGVARAMAAPAAVAVTGGYSIDATEVTRTQYGAWLATTPSTSGQPSACTWNDSYTPSCEWPEGSKGNHPVVCVDWCDAYAYCAAVSKRLCGKIGGGANLFGNDTDATKSQWYNACSSGGAHNYPYGGNPSVSPTDGYDGEKCNGSDQGVGTTVEAGSLTACQSSVPGYSGAIDLSGNVWEWEDSCNGNSGETDFCRLRGNSYQGNLGARCDIDGTGHTRDRRQADDGFRCCSP